MATETFHAQHTAGADVYFRIFDVSGQVFDFNDNTFKALASATTPYVTATERTGMGGSAKSGYTAAVDLANVNNTGSATRIVVKAYDNATPADTDDPITAVAPQYFTVQFGKLGERTIVCRCEAAMTSSAGSEIRFLAWLEHGGEKITLAAGTCTITVREHGAGAALFTDINATPIASGLFESSQSSPGFTDDRVYEVDCQIVENGNTHITVGALAVFG